VGSSQKPETARKILKRRFQNQGNLFSIRHPRLMANLKNNWSREYTFILVKGLNYYWRIVALIGAILFAVSGFLPVVISGAGIVNEYQYVGSEDWSGSFASYPVGTLGLLLLVILWPVALVLGIVSILKRKIALVAGILGVICWAGGIMYDSAGPEWRQYGAGVYVGFVAAALLLVAYYLKPKQAAPSTSPQPFPPPPPPQATNLQKEQTKRQDFEQIATAHTR
jgi:hypothetical protein